MTRAPAPRPLTMYTTTWCGYCRRLRNQLNDAGIPFTEVDVEEDDDAAALVERVNDGNRTVPTLVFPDGSAATNPTLADVRRRIGADEPLSRS